MIILLFLFGVSVLFMRAREDPEEIYRRNSNLRIEVLNGCGINRLAIKVSEILRRDGFNVVNIGNVEDKVFSETVVIERSRSDNANASYFARRIKCKNIGSDIDSALYIDVTLIIGQDYQKLFPDVEKKF
ncbi:MAG: LytR C-terminal domain-containing protein [candidate division WOR-3 bacterium]